jgi:tripartite-type tricarboxylate transporter receptor subunit TctC
MGGVAWRRVAAGIVSLLGLAGPAGAQEYPTRPVTIVVPFGPGSATDTTARLIAQGLQEALGRPFVVENKSGGGGLIAANAVARAEPDGYTLLITTNSTHSAAPGLFKNVPYDPIKDFTAVARLGAETQKILGNPALKARFLAAGADTFWSGPQEFDAYVKTELTKWTSLIKEAGIEPE